MTLLLSLFFISLISITIMFGRKLAMIKEGGEIIENNQNTLEVPYVAEIKHITVRKVRRFGYVGLVTTIRLYFRSKNLIKTKYEDLKTKMKQVHKNEMLEGTNKKEMSRFLKVMSDYKNKVRRIKHQIEEEEKIK
jgi:hypothetical protein